MAAKKTHAEEASAEESTPLYDEQEQQAQTHDTTKGEDSGPDLPKNNDGDAEIPANTSGAGVAVDDDAHDILVPGDEGYEPASDPVIPSSALAEVVATELAGSGESPTRDALVEAAKDKNK